MYTIRKLRQLAKESGIKYFSRMNSQTLCEKLNIPFVRNKAFDTHNKDKIGKPVRIIFKNKETGETIEFSSIYKAAKHLGVNPRYVPQYVKRETIVMMEGKKYSVSRCSQ